jgi:hypothetical protein
MSMLQIAHRQALNHQLFEATVRNARQCADLEPTLSFYTDIEVHFAHQAVFDCLRDMGCLVDWWPHASAIHPIPPGLCNVGDMAVLNIREHPVLLRVLSFKAGQRIVLALGLDVAPILLELSVSHSCPESCRVRLALETPVVSGLWGTSRQRVWLRILGARAGAALARHLRQSPRLADSVFSKLISG